VKINNQFDLVIIIDAKWILQEYKYIFACKYHELKGIALHITQHCIKFNIFIPLGHQAKYQMNPNYAIAVKQDLEEVK
jgi:hypothetical protein